MIRAGIKKKKKKNNGEAEAVDKEDVCFPIYNTENMSIITVCYWYIHRIFSYLFTVHSL